MCLNICKQSDIFKQTDSLIQIVMFWFVKVVAFLFINLNCSNLDIAKRNWHEFFAISSIFIHKMFFLLEILFWQHKWIYQIFWKRENCIYNVLEYHFFEFRYMQNVSQKNFMKWFIWRLYLLYGCFMWNNLCVFR